MKKWFIGFFIICILLLAGLYIFIPGKLTISKITIVNANQNSAHRFLFNENNWKKWWPARELNSSPDSINKNVYSYRSYYYNIEQKMMDAIAIYIKSDETQVNSIVNIIPLGSDSVAIEWKCELSTTSNPVKKIKSYMQAKKIHRNMADILESLQAFLDNKEKVYGISIRQSKVKDTILVTTKAVTSYYPGITFYYNLINDLKKYIASQDGQETGYPMLHIKPIDSNRFETMVAIPVDKRLPENVNILYKRMVAGNILETELKGGPYTVSEAYLEMENYVIDHRKSSPAIPFQSLITDRTKEADTSKWVTKIYYPVL